MPDHDLSRRVPEDVEHPPIHQCADQRIQGQDLALIFKYLYVKEHLSKLLTNTQHT